MKDFGNRFAIVSNCQWLLYGQSFLDGIDDFKILIYIHTVILILIVIIDNFSCIYRSKMELTLPNTHHSLLINPNVPGYISVTCL